MSYERDRDAYRVVSEVRSSGINGERREERFIPRGRGNSNRDINFFLHLFFDVPPKPTDALIQALLFMFFYTFVSSTIYDLILLSSAETFKIVMFVLIIVVLFPTLFGFYAISRNIQLLMGVIYRFVFAIVGIVFGVML